MPNPSDDVKPLSPVCSWSSRILLAAIAAILFLTLFPFRFNFHATLPNGASPFLLGSTEKSSGVFIAFLNVLLFIPLGFGLSEKLRERGVSLRITFLAAAAVGALLSYGIEFLQIYIPMRDSGWEDVFTNTTGCVVGLLVFELFGSAILRCLVYGDTALESWLSPKRIAVVLSAYFALWFVTSLVLQKDTQLSNWDPTSLLLIGNEASGRLSYAWKGKVLSLQFWDRALPDDLARNLTSGNVSEDSQAGLMATYEFSGGAPFQDQRKILPDLFWNTTPPNQIDSKSVYLDGESWLTSGISVGGLVTDLQHTNQFSVRIVCVPAEIDGVDGRIVSISRASGLVNLNLRQEDANLVLWFRSPLSVRGSQLAWYVPDVFEPDRARDILYSYDGSDLSLYVDGNRVPRPYRLSPGTGLARFLRRVKTSELEGYDYLYYCGVFLPAGFLLGIAARKLKSRFSGYFFWLAVGFLLPPLLLELMLVRVSGRSVSIGYVVFSFLLAVGGSLWINADRSPSASAAKNCQPRIFRP